MNPPDPGFKIMTEAQTGRLNNSPHTVHAIANRHSVETFGFIFPAASVDRMDREVCAVATPAVQSKA
jgi:hypothetical protein